MDEFSIHHFLVVHPSFTARVIGRHYEMLVLDIFHIHSSSPIYIAGLHFLFILITVEQFSS